MLAGAPVVSRNKGQLNFAYQDINSDGLLDLIAHFDPDEMTLHLSPGQQDTIGVLNGVLGDGTPISAADSLKIVNP